MGFPSLVVAMKIDDDRVAGRRRRLLRQSQRATDEHREHERASPHDWTMMGWFHSAEHNANA